MRKMRKGKYYSKFKKDYPEPEIVYILEHDSGNLHIGIGIDEKVELFYVQNSLEMRKILSKDILTMSDVEKLIINRKKLTKKMLTISGCSVCGSEISIIDSGLPLCDNCWENSCYDIEELLNKSYTPKEINIKDKELRNLLFGF